MNNKIMFGIVIGAIAIILIFVATLFIMQRGGGALSVVYTATGEVYVGKLTAFPRLILRDGYQFQTVRDENATSTSSRLVPLSDAAWAPVLLYINKEQVVFYGPLSGNSQVKEALENKASE